MGLMEFWFWPFAFLAGAVAIIIGLLVFAFWIWMIIDAAKRNFRNDAEKIIWIVIIVLGSWIGALVYLLTINLTNTKGLVKK